MIDLCWEDTANLKGECRRYVYDWDTLSLYKIFEEYNFKICNVYKFLMKFFLVSIE